jgi:(p)ppGpp synthase/HD superfamily hydrolase
MMERRVNWLQSIRVWQEEFVGTITAREFVDCVTDDLLGRGVFVFTPAGEVMRLPKGSTVLDFAYHVHTDLGNKMIGAKVNGKPVPPDHQLANAEVVEILIYDGQLTKFQVQQHESWLAHAQTRSARHKLLKYLKDNEYLLNPQGLRNSVAVLERTREPRQPSLLHSRVSMDEIEFASAAASAASAAASAAAAVPDAPAASAMTDSLSQQNGLVSHPIQTEADYDGQSAQEVQMQLASNDQQTQTATGTWIVLECHDRAGVLAEVAQIIADYGSNISTYSGSVEKRTGMFRMRFQVQGSTEQTVAIKNAICSSQWVTMCDLE